MAQIKRFEEMEVWKMAFENAEIVYDLTLNKGFDKDFALRDQIRRSAISVFSNIAEGFERDGNREFANFISIAKGSCGELRAQILFAHKRTYISDEQLKMLTERLILTSTQLERFAKYLKNSELKGRKYA